MTKFFPKNLSKELGPSWSNQLKGEFNKCYMKKLDNFLAGEVSQRNLMFPAKSDIFNAFRLTPFEEVKVVIVGQDPYPDANAHGLAFSVPDADADGNTITTPPSLKKIFKELDCDLSISTPKTGNLTKWAEKQGVLLLNSVLTVGKESGSHHGKGWEKFTDFVISTLSQHKKNLVFILWGDEAKEKKDLIEKHEILIGAHPTNRQGKFLGNNHFSQANTYLKEKGKNPINWKL